MRRIIKQTTILLVLICLVGCATPKVVETPLPAGPILSLKPEITLEAPRERKKLWDDGVYVRVPVKGTGNIYDTWLEEEKNNYTPTATPVILQWQVYNNYGEAVARYNEFNSYGYVEVREKEDIDYCITPHGLNIFSYDKMGFIIDDNVYGKCGDYPFEMQGNEFKISSGGEVYTYALPADDYYVRGINDSMVFLGKPTDKGSDYKLINYKTGKDISYRIDEAVGKENAEYGYVRVYMREGCAVICKEDNDHENYFNHSIIIDENGEILYEAPYTFLDNYYDDVYMAGYEYEVDEFEEVTYRGKTYEIPIDYSWSKIKGINETMILLYEYDPDEPEYTLINYKTGKDFSYLLDSESLVNFYKDSVLIASGYSENYNQQCTILDLDGNVIFNDKAIGEYLGYGLFSLQRGNYYGVVNAYGEWLVRTVYLDGD